MQTKKLILITGASSGIGLELLHLYAQRQEETRILAVARHIENIPLYDGKVQTFAADLSKNDDIDQLVSFIRNEWGYLDLCIANAGFAYCEPLPEDIGWDHICRIYSTNLIGQIYLLQHLVMLNRLAHNHPLHFVSTISAVAKIPLPFYALYSSSKAALDMFLDTYRYEKPEWLYLSSVYPIATRTAFFTKASGGKTQPLPMFQQQTGSAALAIYKGICKKRKRIYPFRLFGWMYPILRTFPILIHLYSLNEKYKMKKYFHQNNHHKP